MKAASATAEDLRLLLVTAEKENRSDTDNAAQVEAAINRLRRVLAPVAKALLGAKATLEE